MQLNYIGPDYADSVYCWFSSMVLAPGRRLRASLFVVLCMIRSEIEYDFISSTVSDQFVGVGV